MDRYLNCQFTFSNIKTKIRSVFRFKIGKTGNKSISVFHFFDFKRKLIGCKYTDQWCSHVLWLTSWKKLLNKRRQKGNPAFFFYKHEHNKQQEFSIIGYIIAFQSGITTGAGRAGQHGNNQIQYIDILTETFWCKIQSMHIFLLFDFCILSYVLSVLRSITFGIGRVKVLFPALHNAEQDVLQEADGGSRFTSYQPPKPHSRMLHNEFSKTIHPCFNRNSVRAITVFCLSCNIGISLVG